MLVYNPYVFYRENLSLSLTFPAEVEESRPRDTLRDRSTQATGAALPGDGGNPW